MRIRENFTVFPRTMPSGRKVYYYQCYNEMGRRMPARSTGQSRRTAAIAVCQELYRAGKLVPSKLGPLLKEYAADFWDPEKSAYLKKRQLTGPLSKNSICLSSAYTKRFIVPKWGDIRLGEFDRVKVSDWFVELTNTRNEKGGLYDASTINGILTTLNRILSEAEDAGLIEKNPLKDMKHYKLKKKKRVIFTMEEVGRLFPADWSAVWDRYLFYVFNRTAAYTGMRLREILGVRGENVRGNLIAVVGQYDRFGEFTATKTKKERCVPITPKIREELEELMAANGAGYIFSEDGGETPVSVPKVYASFKAALQKIGIGEKERVERGLTIHSWRHFLNTFLRLQKVPDVKIREITGHSSQGMTELYTDFDGKSYDDVIEVQTKFLDETA